MFEKLKQLFQKESTLASFKVANETFPYLEVVNPECVDENTALIVGLHGFGSDETQIQTLINLELDASYVYLAPRAWYTLPDSGYAWFPVSKENNQYKADKLQHLESLDFLELFIEQAIKHYQINPDKIYLLGYSQGAGVTLSYLMHKPGMVAAAVAMSGNLLPGMKPEPVDSDALKNTPLFLGQGTLDTFILEENRLELKSYLEQQGVNLTYHEYPAGHVVTQKEQQDVERWLNKLISETILGPVTLL